VNLSGEAWALRPLAGGVVAQVFSAQLGVDAEPGGLLGADTAQRRTSHGEHGFVIT
jgi:hypothetical protein